MIVAVRGAPGSFSEGAARKLTGGAAMLNCDTFDEVFAAISSGRAERAVVPLHNSLAGPVYDNAERTRAFEVVGRVHFPVRQCLIAAKAVNVSDLRTVASHPVALRQCTRFFEAHPECVAVPFDDTGTGVRDLMRGDLAVDAVIGSAEAARLYGATILIEGVDDTPDNSTEFVLISATPRLRFTPH